MTSDQNGSSSWRRVTVGPFGLQLPPALGDLLKAAVGLLSRFPSSLVAGRGGGCDEVRVSESYYF